MLCRPYGAGGWNSCERIIDQLRNLGWEKGEVLGRQGNGRKRFKNSELKAVIERNIGLDRRTYKKYRKLLLKLKWITTDDKYHVLLTDAGISKTPPSIGVIARVTPVLASSPPPVERPSQSDDEFLQGGGEGEVLVLCENCKRYVRKDSLHSCESVERERSNSYWDNPVC